MDFRKPPQIRQSRRWLASELADTPLALPATPRGRRRAPAIACRPPDPLLGTLQQCPQRNLQRRCDRDQLEQVQAGIARFDSNNCSFRQAATSREIRTCLLEPQSSRTYGCAQGAHEYS